MAPRCPQQRRADIDCNQVVAADAYIIGQTQKAKTLVKCKLNSKQY